MELETAGVEEQWMADERPGAGDDRLHVEFHMELAQNAERTTAEGRPIFEEVEYIRIYSPGDRNNVIDCPVHDMHRARFEQRYRRWRQSVDKNNAIQGTPLEKWTELQRGDVESLRFLHIYTVEQLASLDDNTLSKHPGLRTMMKKAKDWLDVAVKSAAASRLRAEKEKAEARTAELEADQKVLRERLAKLEAKLLKEK